MSNRSNAFEHENAFYLSCSPQRISKFICHYELFKQTLDLAGDIVEFGVFKGASLSRFAMMRALFGAANNKKIIGFDVFGNFPETEFEQDKEQRKKFIDSAGEKSISKQDLQLSLSSRGLDSNIELVEGDIVTTLPAWLTGNPQARFSLVNLDTDIYEPAVTILENIWPRLVNGGVLLLDDYAVFPGETQAVDEFFKDKPVKIQRFPHAKSPSFIVKNKH
ncbi:TylF/MycF/NovP-related O-methyltransferase [Bowmanella dokdonensis]|uniref:Class I SAM-dependent methyltransferase n=1 Tax=Bowmanella dokdonensis TaxID=751969 RepID=A0A939IQK1_9ALTE|nr:TylF/MycF/NovP-related O-methyltransferase [Bowmanella dokdonensis]MBN7827025.1 class I SAM-dependent methyltransferase [Bowmanella dokdonensis]